MRSMKWFLTVLALLLVPCLLYAQTTGRVGGTVTDPSGAVVGNVTVTLQDTATGDVEKQTTNAAGAFYFPAVKPGTYKFAAVASGFKNYVIAGVQVTVTQTTMLNVKLQVGAVSEIVEVVGTGQELQTTEASVGNVINFRAMQGLPSLSHDATALLQIQPMAIPSYSGPNGAGSGDITAGQVSGARSDQNTINIDGGDATSTCEGDNNYVSSSGALQGVVPTPVESLEEFRVTTNNSTTFSRSAGASVQLVTRRGGDQFHGAGYEYVQNNFFNANVFQNNNIVDSAGKWKPTPTPVWKDNRFGGRLGGPIIKDRIYFFAMYEGERQKQGYNYYRLVPTQNMRNGILTFNGVQYNFATGAPTAMCVVGACDPRGLGMNPTIKQIWSQLPLPNDFSTGDGVNTAGFNYSAPTSSKQNQGIARFDVKLNSKWDLMASGRYATTEQITAKQVLVQADGTAKAVFGFPVQPRLYTVGLTGRLTNNLTNDFHTSFLRQFWGWNPMQPAPQVAGVSQTVQINGESSNTATGMVPLNVDTQNARTRIWNGQDISFTDEVSWLKGKHLIQFGGNFMRQNIMHLRNDKVTGGLSVPEQYVYYSSSYMNISKTNYYPAALPTNLKSTWDNLVADVLGLVNRSSQVLTRAGDFTPNAPGQAVIAHALVKWYDLHVSDSWRMFPTLTFTYGLDWGLQTPPYEINGLQTIMQYASSGKTADIHGYLANLANAANNGQFFVPELQFQAIGKTGMKYPYAMDWHNFSPRLALAWSPAADESSLLGKILGNQKTSIRVGYGRYFDRNNGVGLIMTPALGIGFLDLSLCTSPKYATAGLCSSSKSDPATAFRVGTDGASVPVPLLPAVSGAITPGYNGLPYEASDQRIDPLKKNGVEDTWTLNIQRQLGSKTLVELGYVGRVAHHLYNTYDVNAVPNMFKINGQTFAQAYDAVQKATKFGSTATAPAQPFFDAVAIANGYTGTNEMYTGRMKADGTCCVKGFPGELGNFQTGDVNTLWDDIMPAMASDGLSLPLDAQFEAQQITGSTGNSNYNGMYISVREQAWRGLTFQANYTWSHSFDNTGYGQQWTGITNANQFNPRVDYVSSYFDTRHVINGFMVYDLPFGKGRRFGSSSGWLNKLIGGWQFTAAFQASSGIPEAMYGTSCDELGAGYDGNCAAMVTTDGKKFKEQLVYGKSSSGTSTLQVFPGFATNAAAFDALSSSFRLPLFGDGHTSGDMIRGLNHWNMDSSLNKTTKITERVSFGLSLQVINVFNHPDFGDYSPSLFDTPGTFGLRSRQYNNPRWLNIGMRVDF